MLRRIGGRLVTSPLAFFLAGLIDVLGYWLEVLRRALKSKPLP
jgi:hypothetical protein